MELGTKQPHRDALVFVGKGKDGGILQKRTEEMAQARQESAMNCEVALTLL